MQKTTLFVLLAMVFLIGCSNNSPGADSPSTISSPEGGQVLYGDEVEIVVHVKENVDISTFGAWLNGHEITDRFEPSDGALHAVVGPEDGLRVYAEMMVTSRDEKGVWFIQGDNGDKRSPSEMENYLATRIGSSETVSDRDECVFFVDRSLHDAFESMGYAVAADRLWQAELYRRSARGTLAEIFGPDQLLTDIFVRTSGYSRAALESGFTSLDEQYRSIITGYVDGFNRRIQEIRTSPNLLPLEFAALQYFPEDWRETDVLAVFAFLQRNFDPEALDLDQIKNGMLLQHLQEQFPQTFFDMFNDLRWTNDPEAQTFIAPQVSIASPNATTDILDHLPRRMDSEARESRAGMGNGQLPDLNQAGRTMKAFRKTVRDNLKRINAGIKMGSYAWVVSGQKTASGRPVLYAGPQMGFSVPSIVTEGSINAAGLTVSGMTVPGIPGMLLGRTPHHAWSLQVGHAHTTDYYLESPQDVFHDRDEIIQVAGQVDVTLPVYRTSHGPIVQPMPFDPSSYVPGPSNPIVSWRYSHVGHEFKMAQALSEMARAQSLNEFGEGVEWLAASQHICYADRNGRIAYWMSGRDPVRPPSGDYRLPQGMLGPALEWDGTVLKPRSHDRDPARGYFGGWNNKSSSDYDSGFNSNADIFGPFQRAHVIESYLSTGNDMTFEALRDLALNIATTESFTGPFNGGGNPWVFVEQDFTDAVMRAGLTPERQLAMDTLDQWDGHFVPDGPDNWVNGKFRANAWVLMDAWIKEVIHLTFEDELPKDLDADGNGEETYMGSNLVLLFNVILHALKGDDSAIENNYDWFSNLLDPDGPQNADAIIVTALDNVMAGFGGEIPQDVPRGEITYTHDILGKVWQTPYAFRSTYAQVVEMGAEGPLRIESMLPLGQSGEILAGDDSQPIFNPNFFSMTPIFDAFQPRPFPPPG